MPKQIETIKKEKCIVELRDEKVISLDMLTSTKEYSQSLDYVDKPSITSDTMFKTMIQCEKRKKYAAYLISLVTTFNYKELLKNMTLTTNELPKKYRKTKGQRSDFVAKIKDAYINIEVNNNKDIETLERNLAYCFKLYDQTRMGDKDDYNSTLQINLNNFSYEEIEDTVSIYYLKDKAGIVLTRKIAIMNIWVPNLLKKCYTKGIESLTELEKYIYSLIEVDTKKLDKIISEVSIVKEYVNEAKEVVEEPFFGEAYDHEKANNEQWYNDGYEDGIEKGIEQGEKKTKIEMIKALYDKVPIDILAGAVDLSVEEIEKLLT